MSDTLHSSVLDGLTTRPLSDFSNLKPDSFKEAQITEETSDKKMMPLPTPEIKVIKSKEYEKSVNEVVKNVVIQAKVQAELSKNEENKLRYNHVVDYALDKGTISEQELNVGYQEKMAVIVEKNNKEAESVLKEVDSAIEMAAAALKNIEYFDPANFTEIYLVAMKLDSILDLKLDSSTRHDVENAIKKIHNIMELIEKNVEYNNPTVEEHSNIENPFSFLSKFFAPKFANA